ncbi:MAG TPA: hypothetical protein VFI39_05810 [Gemmatimonadales bacterium]|nr:hypothetical protein [Gemmatimonadales bacterium]
MTRRILISIVLAVALVPGARAQAAPSISPDVDAVATGGYWTLGDQEGHYRLIIVSGGFEHVVSQIYLQWLAQPASPDDSVTVVASIELTDIDSGGWALSDPQFARRDTHWEATVDGQNSHMDPMPQAQWLVILGTPGKYTVAEERSKPQ